MDIFFAIIFTMTLAYKYLIEITSITAAWKFWYGIFGRWVFQSL